MKRRSPKETIKRVTIALESDLVDKLDERVEATGMDRSKYIRRLVKFDVATASAR